MTVDRHYYIYLKTMEKAYEDQVITSDETNLLNIVVAQFGFTSEQVIAALKHVRGQEKLQWTAAQEQGFINGSEPDSDRDLYSQIIMQALADDTITNDEWAIINQLRLLFAFTDAQHDAIEQSVMKKIEEGRSDQLGQFQNYLSTFLGKQFDTQLK